MRITKPYYIVFLLLVLFADARAQKSILKGFLKDSITHYPIVNGSITNWSTQIKVQTDEKGFFFISVLPNDQLYIQSPTYQSDTLNTPSLLADTITIYLSPTGNILEGVTVRSTYSKYQLDSMRRRENFLALRGSRIHVVGSPPPNGFGLNISLDRFFKDKYKKQKKQERFFMRMEEQLYVEHHFSPQLVASYTGLKGDALRSFIFNYSPSYDWLRQHPSQQEVLLYINEKLKLYKKNKQ